MDIKKEVKRFDKLCAKGIVNLTAEEHIEIRALSRSIEHSGVCRRSHKGKGE